MRLRVAQAEVHKDKLEINHGSIIVVSRIIGESDAILLRVSTRDHTEVSLSGPSSDSFMRSALKFLYQALLCIGITTSGRSKSWGYARNLGIRNMLENIGRSTLRAGICR